MSGQDEVNCAFWLATLVGKMGPSCLLGISYVLFLPYNKIFIDQTCSAKMAEYWPCSFLHFIDLDKERGQILRQRS